MQTCRRNMVRRRFPTRLLAKLAGHTMSQHEKDLRSAGYMACARENTRTYVWANATAAEREALKALSKEKDKKKYWALEKVIKDRAKAANAKGKKKA